ncbi:MAG: Uma2 family endonuclease [Moorea sp. SIO3I7]|uniref:Uma2 family endonuclease n=1 Tax=unclassified Moorena TaxID=2683338 RepID=UPI0013C0F45A|nr:MULTISPECIES: Uma2 family endonuclease [unclassified Moorena]NEN97243.1 Uma2 family endonuclease [Moorena sp. SIO3I7]NEO06620.1 Uma2 family endonuclease [Moorena sp. SIO3I8]NEQ60925.1 Uma2 family endonuclease [Moorena sp. SIO4A1]
MTSLPYPSQPLISPRQTLPTMYDLPSENPKEPGLPDEFHFFQPLLLLLTFAPANSNPELVFSACDLNLYYDLNHPGWYKRPDWFGVVGVPRLYESKDLRLSYVIWQEQVSPFVVVELLSPGTEDEDHGQTVSAPGKPPTKWQVYEQILRVPYYVIFSRYTNELQGFHLVGDHYKPAVLNQDRLLMPELGLSLGLWRGSFRDIPRLWLRWMTLEGNLIPLASEELAQAQLEAIKAKQRAERLAARLRELGINPDQLD